MGKNFNEEYERRMAEVREKMHDPERHARILEFLANMEKEVGCEFHLLYQIYPETEDYAEHMQGDKFTLPRNSPAMRLEDFVKHIAQEDKNYKVYLDPIYLGEGVNEVNDVLTTTVEDAVIIIPVSHKKPKEL